MKHILICSIAILFFSCNHTSDNANKILFNNSIHNTLDSIFPNQEFVFLESSRGGLIGLNIEKVIRYKKCYFILNKTSAGSELLVFDQLGRYKFKIGKKGNGAEEYRYLNDFFIDKKNDEVYLHLGSQGCFYIYSLDNTFLRSKEYDDNLSYIRKAIASDSLLYCFCDRYEPPYCNFIIYDYHNNCIKDTIYNLSKSDAFIIPQTFNVVNHNIIYINGGDSILQINTDNTISLISQIEITKKMTDEKKRIVQSSSKYNSLVDDFSQKFVDGKLEQIIALLSFEHGNIIQTVKFENAEKSFRWGMIYNNSFSIMADVDCNIIELFKNDLRFICNDVDECYAFIEPYRLDDEQLLILNNMLSHRASKKILQVDRSDNPILIRLYNEK